MFVHIIKFICLMIYIVICVENYRYFGPHPYRLHKMFHCVVISNNQNKVIYISFKLLGFFPKAVLNILELCMVVIVRFKDFQEGVLDKLVFSLWSLKPPWEHRVIFFRRLVKTRWEINIFVVFWSIFWFFLILTLLFFILKQVLYCGIGCLSKRISDISSYTLQDPNLWTMFLDLMFIGLRE